MEVKKYKKKHRPEFEAIRWTGKMEDLDWVLDWVGPTASYRGNKLIMITRANGEQLFGEQLFAREAWYIVDENGVINTYDPETFNRIFESKE